MWKWIVGALLVLVVAVAATCYVGYKKFTAGGDSVTVTIAGSPDRVFMALADVDSISTWMRSNTKASVSHHGALVVGDTVHVESTSGLRSGRNGQFSWVVTELVPGRLLVREVLSDTSNQIVAMRRDSLIGVDDSTRIISTIASPLMDSIRTLKGDTVGRVGNAVLDFSSKVLISLFRTVSEDELRRLKTHIEGKSAPAVRP